jgi:hypothetical protein
MTAAAALRHSAQTRPAGAVASAPGGAANEGGATRRVWVWRAGARARAAAGRGAELRRAVAFGHWRSARGAAVAGWFGGPGESERRRG